MRAGRSNGRVGGKHYNPPTYFPHSHFTQIGKELKKKEEKE